MIVVRVCINAQTEHINTLRTILAGDILETSKFDGCTRFDVYQDIQDESGFILYEEWDNQQSFDAYRESDYFKEIGGKLFPLLEGTPDSAYYEAEKIS